MFLELNNEGASGLGGEAIATECPQVAEGGWARQGARRGRCQRKTSPDQAAESLLPPRREAEGVSLRVHALQPPTPG